jgi:hypothetical protein
MSISLDTQTTQLITHLRRGGNYSYIWAASQAKGQDNQAVWKCTYWHNGTGPGDMPSDQHAQYGAVNLYFGVHPVRQIPQERKNKKGKVYRPQPGNVRPMVEEINALNALYAEYDAKDFGGSKPAILEHIAELPAVHSIIIDSGGGYHCYWLLAEPYILDTSVAREHARRLQDRWVTLVGGDDDAHDLSRVLRLPGTLNYKYDPPRPITFVRAEFDRLYDLADLEAELPPEASCTHTGAAALGWALPFEAV